MEAAISNADDFVFSFKPHGGHDAPLLVVRADSPGDMANKLKTLEELATFTLVANADTALKAQWNLAKGIQVQPVNNPAVDAPAGIKLQIVPGSEAGAGDPRASGGYTPNQGGQRQQSQPQGGSQGGGGRRPVDPPAGVQVPSCDHGPKVLFPEGKWGPFWACSGPRDAAKGANCKFEKYQGPPLP